jgi:hypothetical protein
MQMHGPRSPREKDRDLHWRIKAKTSEELRQEFLTIYVPRIRELGLVIPDRSSGSTRRPGSGRTPTRTGKSSGRSSRTTARCRRHGSSSVGWRGKRRAGCATPFSSTGRGMNEPAAMLEPWEVFRQEKEGDPMRTVAA